MLLWLDLETTGLDARRNRILEVAWTITHEDLTPVMHGVKSHVVTADLETLDQLEEFNEKLDMHVSSGLSDEVFASELTMLLEDIEDEILQDIKNTGGDGASFFISGAGVHYDLNFLHTWMPRLHERLHYRLGVEVSSLSRWYEWQTGVTFPTHNDAPHRAAADVYEAIDRARQMQQWMKGQRELADVGA